MPAPTRLILLMSIPLTIGQPTPASAPPPAAASSESVSTRLLLPDMDTHPRVEISWQTSHSERIELSGIRAYTGDAGRQPLGENIDAFAAIGGTRLSKSAGHPAGLILRAGFYKADPSAPFFRDIPKGGTVRVRFSSIRVNQPASPRVESIVQHLKFSLEDLESCAIPDNARAQFNLYSETELLNARVTPGVDARPGVLASEATVRTWTEDDDSITLEVEFAYALLRHILDPWDSQIPGTFVEPVHFHFEVELLPSLVYDAIESGEQVWPPASRDLDELDQQALPDD